jgi:quinol monooxygenase YgiN
MYGTVARLRLKRGMESRLQEVLKVYEEVKVPGYVASYVYRLDNSPNEYYLSVIFENRELYRANASSPEQDARYRKLAALLDGEPQWHDGEIIFAHTGAPELEPAGAGHAASRSRR